MDFIASCNQCSSIIGEDDKVCSNCGVAYTGDLDIFQLEEIIRNGSLKDFDVLSAMTDASKAYLRGEKDAQEDLDKGREYLRTAAKNGGGDALFMMGLADITGLEEVTGEFTQEEKSLINSGLYKLACGHHMGNEFCTSFLNSYIEDGLWDGLWDDMIQEMMKENTSDLWDW